MIVSVLSRKTAIADPEEWDRRAAPGRLATPTAPGSARRKSRRKGGFGVGWPQVLTAHACPEGQPPHTLIGPGGCQGSGRGGRLRSA